MPKSLGATMPTPVGVTIAELQDQIRQLRRELAHRDVQLAELRQRETARLAARPDLLLVYDHTNHGEVRLYYDQETVNASIVEMDFSWGGDELSLIQKKAPSKLRLYEAGHRDFLGSTYQEEITMLRAELYRTQGTYVRTFAKFEEMRNAVSDALDLVRLVKQERDDAIRRAERSTTTEQAVSPGEAGPGSQGTSDLPVPDVCQESEHDEAWHEWAG